MNYEQLIMTAPGTNMPEDEPTTLMGKFKKNFDPLAFGLGAFLEADRPGSDIGTSLASGLLMGRQARLMQAQEAAAGRAAARKESMDMATSGLEEFEPGKFRKKRFTEIKTSPQGAILSVEQGGSLDAPVINPLYTPPEKAQEQKDSWTIAPTPITTPDGRVVQLMVNKYTGETREVGGSIKSPGAGGVAGGKPNKQQVAALENAQASAYPLNELRQVITSPERMAEQAGPVNRLENFVNMKVLGVGTPATADANILSSGSIETIMGDISKLVPASDADVKMLREAKLPPPGDRKAWVNYYNRQVAEYKRILNKYPEGQAYLQSPEFQQALQPISMESRPDAPVDRRQELRNKYEIK